MTEVGTKALPGLPAPRRDLLPLALCPVLMAIAYPLVGSGSTWVTLTVAGLAMGMMIFLMAAGLTLVFGLMDVINFGHGVFISIGAYAMLLVLGPSGILGRSGFADAEYGAATSLHDRRHGYDSRARLCVREGDRPAGLWQPSQADPRHHGRDDHCRASYPRALGCFTSRRSACPKRSADRS